MPPDVDFGCQLIAYDDVDTTVEQAVRAERAGFDLLTVPDHLFHPTGSEAYLVDPPWEAFSVLGAVAATTSEARLMPGVADSVRRHPTELAHATATLDRLADGRGGLGLGAGEAFNFAPVKDLDWSKPFTRFREAFEVVTGLWNSTAADPLSFDGEYFELEDAHMGFKPAQESPPLWVGGYGPKMRTLTGRHADGWFPWIYTPETYASDLQRVQTAAREAGRDPADLTNALMLPTAVGEDGAAVREAALERNRANLALRPPLLREMGYEDVAEDATYMYEMAFEEEQRDQLSAVAERIPDEAVAEIALAGTPEEVVADVERFAEAGVDQFVTFVVGDFEETMRHYEETIIPHFDGE